MTYQEINNVLGLFRRCFLSLVNKPKKAFQRLVVNVSLRRLSHCIAIVPITGNLLLSFFFLLSLKTVLQLRFSLGNSVRSKCIVTNKILDVLERWEAICIQETIFCCEQGTPMLEGDEEALIHLVGKKEMEALQQYWNFPWNTKLGEKKIFFNGNLSQTFASDFHLLEYIELSTFAHRLLLASSRRRRFPWFERWGATRETPYHPLLNRLDFIIQYSLFRRMILVQEYRLYESLLGAASATSFSFSSTMSDSLKRQSEEKKRMNSTPVLRSGDDNPFPCHTTDNSLSSCQPSTRNSIYERRRREENMWVWRREDFCKKKKRKLEGEEEKERYGGGSRLSGGDGDHEVNNEDAWRICGAPSWLLLSDETGRGTGGGGGEGGRERELLWNGTSSSCRCSSSVTARFLCVPPSYFPVESVMTHFSDWLYDELLERMIPVWKREALGSLRTHAQLCTSCRVYGSDVVVEEEKKVEGKEWEGWRKSDTVEEERLFRGRTLAAYSAVNFWFVRYTSVLVEKQKKEAEETASRFYQRCVYDRLVNVSPMSLISNKFSRWRDRLRRGYRVMEEKKGEDSAAKGTTEFCIRHGSSPTPLPPSFSFPTGFSMPSMKARRSRIRKLLFLEGSITCVITCLDFFSTRIFSETAFVATVTAVATAGVAAARRKRGGEGAGVVQGGREADPRHSGEGRIREYHTRGGKRNGEREEDSGGGGVRWKEPITGGSVFPSTSPDFPGRSQASSVLAAAPAPSPTTTPMRTCASSSGSSNNNNNNHNTDDDPYQQTGNSHLYDDHEANGRARGKTALSHVSKQILWSLLTSVLSVLLRGVRREVAHQLSEALTEDLEGQVASALTSADHGFLDLLFSSEMEYNRGRNSSGVRGGGRPGGPPPFSSVFPRHHFNGRGFSAPSAKGFMRRVAGAGQMIVTKFDISIRWWTTQLALPFIVWWENDWSTFLLAWGFVLCHKNNIVEKISRACGLTKDTHTRIWLREQSPPFHRTGFGLTLLMEILSEMVESPYSYSSACLSCIAAKTSPPPLHSSSSSSSTPGRPSSTPRRDASAHQPEGDGKSFSGNRTNPLPFPVLSFLVCSDIWQFPEWFFPCLSSSSSTDAKGRRRRREVITEGSHHTSVGHSPFTSSFSHSSCPFTCYDDDDDEEKEEGTYWREAERAERVRCLYQLLTAPFTLPEVYQHDPRLMRLRDRMYSMQEMVAGVLELVVQPAMGRIKQQQQEVRMKRASSRPEPRGVKDREKGKEKRSRDEKKEEGVMTTHLSSSSSSSPRGRQAQVYDLDPEEEEIVQNPEAMSYLPSSSSGELYAHFNRHSFLLLRQLGLESIMTHKVLAEKKARQKAEEDFREGQRGGGGGGGSGIPIPGYWSSSSFSGYGCWQRVWWWVDWLGRKCLTLLDHDGGNNPFVILLEQGIEWLEVELLAACTCIGVRRRRESGGWWSSSSSPFSVHQASKREGEEAEKEGRRGLGLGVGRGRLCCIASMLHDIDIPSLEWYTAFTAGTAALIVSRSARLPMYQRALLASFRKDHRNDTRFFSGIDEILSHLPRTMSDQSPRASSEEMTRRRHLWREYLSFSSERSTLLQYNDQHFITGGMYLREGIRFHHVHFLYPQVHYGSDGAMEEEKDEEMSRGRKSGGERGGERMPTTERIRMVEEERDGLMDRETATTRTSTTTGGGSRSDSGGSDTVPVSSKDIVHHHHHPPSSPPAGAGRRRTTPLILSDVELFFPSSGMTAVIGPTGAGKSTLLHLLTRVYEPIPEVWIKVEEEKVEEESSSQTSSLCCFPTSVLPSEKMESQSTSTTAEGGPMMRHPDEEKEEKKEGRTPWRAKRVGGCRNRIPWSRALLEEIVYQMCEHTLPLPPTTFSSTCSSSSFPATTSSLSPPPARCASEWEEREEVENDKNISKDHHHRSNQNRKGKGCTMRVWKGREKSVQVGLVHPGYLSYDTIPAACFSLSYLRRWFITMEPSTTVLPHRTFEANIRFTHEDVRERDVAWAAEASQCMKFIQKFPLQLQQPVSFTLSGGEQQRLGMARVLAVSAARLRGYRLSHAFYPPRGCGGTGGGTESNPNGGRDRNRSNSSVVAVVGVLLDEPTSRLDARNERKVERAMRSLLSLSSCSSLSRSPSSSLSSSSPWMRGMGSHRGMGMETRAAAPAPACMAVVVAHRLSTIQTASHLIVLKNGKVEAEGNPQEVVSTSPFAMRQLALQRLPGSLWYPNGEDDSSDSDEEDDDEGNVERRKMLKEGEGRGGGGRMNRQGKWGEGGRGGRRGGVKKSGTKRRCR